MPETIVFGFVALMGSKFLCVCFHSLATGKSPGLCFHFAKRKNQNICFHLPIGNSFVMFHPSKEEIIMLPFAKDFCKLLC